MFIPLKMVLIGIDSYPSMIIYDSPWYPHSIPSEDPLSSPAATPTEVATPMAAETMPRCSGAARSPPGDGTTGPRTGQRGGTFGGFSLWKMGTSQDFAMENGT